MSSRSPTAITPGLKSSAPQTPAPIKEAPTRPQAVPFPPPQTFDFTPPLHGLILRLLSPQTNHEGVTNGEGTSNDGSGPGQGQSQPQPSSGVGNENNTAELLGAVPSSAPGPTSAAADIAALGSNLPPALDIKSLPTEVSSIKIRIQKAQAVVENLPDVDRTVAEQEREIQELEDRIAKLKSVISDFGRRANTAIAEKSKPSGS
ncbi:RNA polymerase II transcription mediator complex subunit 9-domain-containing protein [Aspergillus pseudoustus]|uniref:Mediator of RNA polymerase II transcription subunit 9 n=1 Tax=Aspergillus pseudoustus TaxID=1810923 RepID=A0ABR4JGG8_9EURO